MMSQTHFPMWFDIVHNAQLFVSVTGTEWSRSEV